MNEEMQRTMQFILEQQAQLTIKLDSLSEKVDKLAGKVDKLADAQVRHEARTSQLEDSFLILVQLATSSDERMDELTAAQKHTDERLSALIDTVERFINGRGHGDAQV